MCSWLVNSSNSPSSRPTSPSSRNVLFAHCVNLALNEPRVTSFWLAAQTRRKLTKTPTIITFIPSLSGTPLYDSSRSAKWPSLRNIAVIISNASLTFRTPRTRRSIAPMIVDAGGNEATAMRPPHVSKGAITVCIACNSGRRFIRKSWKLSFSFSRCRERSSGPHSSGSSPCTSGVPVSFA
ncbi:hypothetical protein BJX66DRAFT_303402 [Aspergillus keveii]|uniref:Uncharacterized protein n=1 Tax=Aspergillus keveii TaxID=714993 RepID=A0ABR4G690_9EURO